MLFSKIIAFFFVGFFGFVSPTSFKFNGTVKCESEKEWCFAIAAIERDHAWSNDLMGFQHWKCYTENEATYKITSYEYWDGLIDQHFELGYKIWWECNNKKAKNFINSAVIPTYLRYYSEEMIFDLNLDTVNHTRSCKKFATDRCI